MPRRSPWVGEQSNEETNRLNAMRTVLHRAPDKRFTTNALALEMAKFLNSNWDDGKPNNLEKPKEATRRWLDRERKKDGPVNQYYAGKIGRYHQWQFKPADQATVQLCGMAR